MTQIEQIKADIIETLSQQDFEQLRVWLIEKDWQLWDRQIEKDSAEGKLDFLRKEVMEAKAQRKLQEL